MIVKLDRTNDIPNDLAYPKFNLKIERLKIE
jgi:hypothetical protein